MKKTSDKTPGAGKENRNKWLHLRLSEAEYQQLRHQFASTTERKLSSYARHILLGKPMYKGVRNLTTEAMIRPFAQLLKDLNGLANNYNQAVHKLHVLQRHSEYKNWLVSHEMDRRKLLKEVAEIRDFIHKNAALWLQ